MDQLWRPSHILPSLYKNKCTLWDKMRELRVNLCCYNIEEPHKTSAFLKVILKLREGQGRVGSKGTREACIETQGLW